MSDRLTDEYLDQLDALRSEATPGPWEADRRGGVTAIFEGMTEVISESSDQVHADLIADAHNALPALLAEVREHRAREAARRAALDTLVDGDDR